MNPTLVPTLAELDIELNRAVAACEAAASAHHAQPGDPDRQGEVAHGALAAFEIVTQITHLQAASVSDLRVKAKALAQLFAAVPDSKPMGWEQRRLCQQIIDGLLDEGIV